MKVTLYIGIDLGKKRCVATFKHGDSRVPVEQVIFMNSRESLMDQIKQYLKDYALDVVVNID